jgi:hypothetical protein
MAPRRPLIEGLNAPAMPVDPAEEKAFVYQNKDEAPAKPKPISAEATTSTKTTNRTQFSKKMRTDLFDGLKRASLQRQLAKVEPSTLQDILEQAVEPWLIANGYLP